MGVFRYCRYVEERYKTSGTRDFPDRSTIIYTSWTRSGNSLLIHNLHTPLVLPKSLIEKFPLQLFARCSRLNTFKESRLTYKYLWYCSYCLMKTLKSRSTQSRPCPLYSPSSPSSSPVVLVGLISLAFGLVVLGIVLSPLCLQL